MRKGLFLLFVLMVAAGLTAAVTGTKHDLSVTNGAAGASDAAVDEICVFCHTPHMAETTPPDGQYPLWNHTVSTTAAFGVYDSPTFDGGGSIADIASTVPNQNTSMLCMSCHDGTVAVESLYNNPNGYAAPDVTGTSISGTGMMQGNALLGTDLTNDHPVNFLYSDSDTADVEIVAVNVTITGLLDGAGNVQCSSCHDVHGGVAGTPMLQVSNVQSALCLTCHIK